jgi:hypothetical protein
MTVATHDNKVTYACDGTRRAFEFGFKIFAPTDLVVVAENALNGEQTPLTLNEGFTVRGVNAEYSGGGTVTTAEVWPATHTLTILRRVGMLQETDYRSTETFSAAAHEAAMDRMTMMIQQLAETLGRALRVSVTDEALGELPPAVVRANKYFAFDADGQIITKLTAAGEALMSGSAICYVGDYSAAWPTTRPDGITPLDLSDSGRSALDTGGGRMRMAYYVHGYGETVQASWIVLVSVYNGNLIIGPSPVTTLEFQESDQADPAGRVRIQMDNDTLTILRKTASGSPGTWTAAATIARSTGAVTLAGSAQVQGVLTASAGVNVAGSVALGGSGKVTGLQAGTSSSDALRVDQLPAGEQAANGTSNQAISSNQWTDLANMSVTLTTRGRAVLLLFSAAFQVPAGGDVRLRFLADATPVHLMPAAVGTPSSGTGGTLVLPLAMQTLVTGLSAGSHTFKVQWMAQSGTINQLGASGHVRTLTAVEL